MISVFALFLIVLNLCENVYCEIGNNFLNTGRFTPETIIPQLSELVRSLIKNGDPELGIPVLDPYEFQHAGFNFTGDVLKVDTNINHGKLSGLGNFQLQQFNFSKNEISIEFNVNVPSLELFSDHYELVGSIYDAIPLKGEGVASIAVHNLTVWGKIYLKQSQDGKAIVLDKFENTEFSIDQILSRTEFDNNIDNVISGMVQDLLAGYLTRFSRFLTAAYSDSLVQFVNKTLEQYETWNLIAIIISMLNED